VNIILEYPGDIFLGEKFKYVESITCKHKLKVMLSFTIFTKPQGQALLDQQIYPNKNLTFSFIHKSWAYVKKEFIVHISCIPNTSSILL
jgi:hypothetical protein